MNDIEGQKGNSPASITSEEFDRKAEAGEDVDGYFDWQNTVVVEPGEMSPGQLASLLALFNELAPDQQATFLKTAFEAISGQEARLNISVPWPLHLELAREAQRLQTSRETLVQSWIAQHLQNQKAVK